MLFGMPELTGDVHIEARREAVFAFVDDWHQTTRYLRGLVRWEPADPDHVQGLGTRFAAAIKAGPVTLEGKMEVTEHVPPERIAFTSIEGPRLDGLWVFDEEDGGTRVTLTNDFELPGGMAGRVVGKLASTQGKKDLDASLAELKRLVEREG